MDLNKVMIIGRLAQDPDSRTTPQGISVTNFSVATNRVWKNQDGTQQESTEFHNVVAWRKLAEICAQYLSKGRQVYIEGHLQTRSWESGDGQKRYRTEIVADNMIMLGNRTAPAPIHDQTRQESKEPFAFQESENVPPQTPQRETVAVGATPQPFSDEEIRIEDIPF